MSLRFRRRTAAAFGLLLLWIAGPAAHGQASAPSAPPARPDPLNPKAVVPPVAYKSALGGYRPAGEVKVGSWKDANDAVTRIGGWRAYAREVSPPEGGAAATPVSTPAAPAAAPVAPASPPASAPAPRPAPPSGGGHGHHGKP